MANPAQTKPRILPDQTKQDATNIPVESKADAFRRLASARVSKALDVIANIGHLANVSQYDYTDDQVDRIVTALEQAVSGVKAKFDAKGRSSGGFSL